MRSTIIGMVAFALGLPTAASAAPTTTLDIQTASVSGGQVTITGRLVLGDDARAKAQVGTDGADDAMFGDVGADVGNAFVTPDVTARRLTFTLEMHDGAPVLDGPGPAIGAVWPFVVDDVEVNAWLAGGTVVSGWPPKATKWTELCYTDGSYFCGIAATGSVSATQISWTIPFRRTAAPAYNVRFGSRVAPGAASPGAPATLPWAALLFNGNPLDTVGETVPYTVPGGVEVAIAPVGTPQSELIYDVPVEFNAISGGYVATHPTLGPGAQEVHVRSCFGAGDEPTCVHASRTITV